MSRILEWVWLPDSGPPDDLTPYPEPSIWFRVVHEGETKPWLESESSTRRRFLNGLDDWWGEGNVRELTPAEARDGRTASPCAAVEIAEDNS